VALLDLGAVSEYPAALVAGYRSVCRAVLADDERALLEALYAIGYAHPDDPEPMTRNALAIIRLACEPLTHRGPYDFAGSGLLVRGRDFGLDAVFGKGLRSPPAETLFLHRKLVGTFMICAKLHARVNVHALIERFVQ
jgi:predicted unusual protein kinase regulating ubiquinone biosynthesis (AarF/ABC1/UbiB family)